MKEKRYSEFFTYVHFTKTETNTQIKEYIEEELRYNESQLTEDESGDSRLLKYKIDSDIIDYYYSDIHGNKVSKEESLTEDDFCRVLFNRIIISDYEGEEYYLEGWTVQNDYLLITQKIDNLCKHNNTITNECSDCNELELTPKTIYKKDKKMSLQEMQKEVGGYIEVAYDDGKTQIICNEEGKLRGCRINKEATRLWEELLGRVPMDVLVGDILVLTEKARLV